MRGAARRGPGKDAGCRLQVIAAGAADMNGRSAEIWGSWNSGRGLTYQSGSDSGSARRSRFRRRGASSKDRQATRESAVDVEVRNEASKRHCGEGQKIEQEELCSGKVPTPMYGGYMNTVSQVSML